MSVAKVPVGRFILCNFCVPAHRWHVPEGMSADEAMAWFFADHIPEHVEDVVLHVAEAAPRCRPCKTTAKTDHRPCFAVDCACECSATERTAHAE